MRNGDAGRRSASFGSAPWARDAELDSAGFDEALFAEAESWAGARMARREAGPEGRPARDRIRSVGDRACMTGTVPKTSRSAGRSAPSPGSILAGTPDGRLPAFDGTRAILERRTACPSASRSSAAETGRPGPLSVSETLERLRGAMEGVVDGLWIAGEVADVTRSAAGHVYFSLKDAHGVIDCVQFAGRARVRGSAGDGTFLAVGDRVEVKGAADVYPPRGRLQLVIREWRPAGAGSLYEAFLRLRARLEAEGLFQEARKKPLPPFIRRIALVTSAEAAAYHDVLRTIERRTPWVRIRFAEAPVQGRGAPDGLIAALRAADRAACDVILLVRGGGAYEDLQAFNDERLARTIAALRTPLVSGIGHESDMTIADLVADLRASTPTAAAEAVGADAAHWDRRLARSGRSLSTMLERQVRHAVQRLDRAEAALPEPERLFGRLEGGLGRMAGRLADPEGLFAVRERRLRQAAGLLVAPESLLLSYERHAGRSVRQLLAVGGLLEARRLTELEQSARRLSDAPDHLAAALQGRLDRVRDGLRLPERALGPIGRRVELAAAALALADPDRPLRAGYARVLHAGATVSGVAGLTDGDAVTLLFADGRAEAVLGRVEHGKAG